MGADDILLICYSEEVKYNKTWNNFFYTVMVILILKVPLIKTLYVIILALTFKKYRHLI